MNRTAAIGRADLLRALLAAGSERSVPVGLVGYERRPAEADQTPLPPAQYPDKMMPLGPASEDSGTGPRAFRKIEPGERLVKFLAPVELEVLKEEPLSAEAPACEALSDRELAMPAATAESVDSLVPWSRLAPFLRRRLGVVLSSRTLDYRRLSRWVASGRPWFRLPRCSRLSWGHSACVVWDTSPEMEPYQADVAQAVRRLKRERGPGGLRIVRCYGPPSALAGLPPQIPVLVFSAMGQLQADLLVAWQWAALGRTLAHAGHRTTALSPCPRRFQETGAVSVWPTAVWDRRQRLPRRLPPPRTATETEADVFGNRVPCEAAELLLDLLAAATLVTPGLLRRVRLLLVPEADAGAEYEVWYHADTTGSESLRYFSLRPGVAHESRLRRFRMLAANSATADPARQASALIDRHHEDLCSLAIALEAGLRGAVAGAGDARATARWLVVLQRVVERLRDLADAPGSPAGVASGLPRWFSEWVDDRLSAETRAHPVVAELVAQGLALARKFLGCVEAPWPEGIATETAVRELRRHALRRGQVPARTYRLGFRGCDLILLPDPPPPVPGWFELGTLRAGESQVHLTEFVECRPSPSGPPTAPEPYSEQTARGDAETRRETSATSSLSLSAASAPPREPFQLRSMERPGLPEPGRRLTSVRIEPEKPLGSRLLTLAEPGPILIESDRERLRLDALVRPAWASRLTLDRAGLEAELDLGTERHAVLWTLPTVQNSGDASARSPEGPVAKGAWVPQSRPKWAERLWVDGFGVAAEFMVGGVPFALRWIPPGRFLMGSPDDEPGRWDDEGPQHEVTISRGFWLSETPVTQAQWRAVVEAAQSDPVSLLAAPPKLDPAPSYFRGPAELPVEQVSYVDCGHYCVLLNSLLPSGPGFVLPTEAQWEFACRAGTQSAVYTGGISILGENHAPELDPIAWYGGNSGLDLEVRNPWDSSSWPNKHHDHSRAGTHRVAKKDPNPLGLYDMLGNVREWCRDGWGGYDNQAVADPYRALSSEGAYRVVRGGSWSVFARDCRAASRNPGAPGYRFGDLGFRLAAGQELQVAAEPPAGGRLARGRGRRGGAGAEGRSPEAPAATPGRKKRDVK